MTKKGIQKGARAHGSSTKGVGKPEKRKGQSVAFATQGPSADAESGHSKSQDSNAPDKNMPSSTEDLRTEQVTSEMSIDSYNSEEDETIDVDETVDVDLVGGDGVLDAARDGAEGGLVEDVVYVLAGLVAGLQVADVAPDEGEAIPLGFGD